MFLCPHCEIIRFPRSSATQKKPTNPIVVSHTKATQLRTEVKSSVSAAATPEASFRGLGSIAEIAKEGKKDTFCAHFSQNIDSIFQYAFKDIQQALAAIEMSLLQALHKCLCDQVQIKFPQYKDMRPVNRQVKHTILPDIYHLGISLTNGSTPKDLEKIFLSRAAGALNQEETQELLQAVALLTNKVSVLEKSVCDLSSANEALKCSINDLHSKSIPCQQCSLTKNSTNESALHTSDSESDSSSPTEDEEKEDPFHFQNHFKWKLSKRERKQRRSAQKASQSVPDVTTSSSSSLNHISPDRTFADVASTAPKTPVSAPTVRGGSQSQSLQAAANSTVAMADIYIGGVDSQHSTQDIKKHIHSLGVLGTSHIKILSTRGQWRSFHALVPKEHANITLDASKWPKGIKLRPFRAQREQGIRAAPTSGPHQTQQRRSGPIRPRHGHSGSWHNQRGHHQSRNRYQERSQAETWSRGYHYQHPSRDFHGYEEERWE